MSQLQAGSFRGADVDGLDRIVRRMNDAAEFADDVVTALRVLAAALDAMSWTGWAAAFARYLRAVVIPWVQTVSRYLKGFAQVLALISQTQKDTSADTPTVHVPAAAFTPVRLPATSTANAPVLAAPDPAVAPSAAGGGAAGAGAQVVVPVSIGSVTVHVNGAAGGQGHVTTPTAPVVRPETGGGASGAGVVGVDAGGIGAPGPTPGHSGGVSGGGSAGAPSGGPSGASGGGSGGGSGAGSGSLGSSPTFDAPGPEAAPAGASGPAPSPLDRGAVGGDPAVRATAVGIGSTPVGDLADARAASATGLAALEPGSGAPVALAAAPLGLAALGAAALGALRQDDDEPEPDAAPVPVDLSIDRRPRT